MTEETLRSTGKYFEELSLGDTMVTPARTVTETDIVLFAGLSGDYNQLHTDAEFAGSSRFGERIAHGLLGLAVASGLASRLGSLEGTALAFMGLDWRFRGPIMIGDTVHAVVRVAQSREMGRLGGGLVVFAIELVNQRGETVQDGKWNILVKSKGS